MYVWVLTRDCDSKVIGIYATPEAAIEAAQPKRGEDETKEIVEQTERYIHFAERYDVEGLLSPILALIEEEREKGVSPEERGMADLILARIKAVTRSD